MINGYPNVRMGSSKDMEFRQKYKLQAGAGHPDGVTGWIRSNFNPNANNVYGKIGVYTDNPFFLVAAANFAAAKANMPIWPIANI